MASYTLNGYTFSNLDLGDGGTIGWSGTSTAIRTSDNVYAHASGSLFGGTKTYALYVAPLSSILNSAIPVGSTIVGIQVRFERHRDGTTAADSRVQLAKSTTAVGTNKSTGTALPSSDAYVTHGGSSDLWGTTWTRDEIVNDLRFLYQVTGLNSGSDDAYVDHVEFTIYYSLPAEFAASISGAFAGTATLVGTEAFSGAISGAFDGTVTMGGAVLMFDTSLAGVFSGTVTTGGALSEFVASLVGTVATETQLDGGYLVEVSQKLKKIRVATIIRFYND